MTLDHSVPMPGHRGGFFKYDWAGMRVGDSFFEPDKSIHSMSSVALRAGRRLGMTFTCSTVTEGEGVGVLGVRVWRKT